MTMRLEETTRTLRALGDETRLRMLALLEREELSVSELQEALNMGQSRISTQLTQLREAGLVQDRRSGRRNFYQLTTGRSVDFLDSVLDPHRESEEFQRDQEGLKAVLARRREDSRSYFDRVAAAFGEQVLPGRTWEGLSRAILRLAPRGNYADLGIGDGLLTLMLAQVADQVTAVDLSKEMLNQLKLRAGKRDLNNINYVEGDIEDLPLPDAQFDVVVLSQALHHAQQPRQALAEARRIIKPGGRLLVIELLAHNESWVKEQLQHIHQGFTENELTELIQATGFENLLLERAARDPQPPNFMTLVASAQATA
ncbi:MAG: metalloregulator ArsR/SmtB family transcription factor [bacterium]